MKLNSCMLFRSMFLFLVAANSSQIFCPGNDSNGQPDNNRKFKLLIGSSAKYMPVFLNWLAFYKAVCKDTYPIYFVCFDHAIEGEPTTSYDILLDEKITSVLYD